MHTMVIKTLIIFIAAVSVVNCLTLEQRIQARDFDNPMSDDENKKRNTNNDVDTTKGLEQETVTVQTNMGAIKGVLKDGVRVFHGVPYAQPPVGDLRWRPPEPSSPWSPSVFDATWTRPACPQHCGSIYCVKKMSEDCLYLEISTPVLPESNSKVPVNVYIHGGAFSSMSASSPLYDSTRFVQRSGVIVVKIEHRIGVLGFLVTNSTDDAAAGNFGLLDQRLALEWVRDNIDAFGGDPSQVTLHGQSAGAQAIVLHLASKESSKLFHRVITESNPLSLNYVTASEATKRGQIFAELLGCDNEDGTVDMACLKDKDAFLVTDTQSKVGHKLPSVWDKIQTFTPVVDGDIVRDQPIDAFGRYCKETESPKPMLMGVTSVEAYNYIRGYVKDPISPFIYSLLKLVLFGNVDASEFDQAYPSKSQTDAREDFTTVASDYIFRCPLRSVSNQCFEDRHDNIWIFEWAHLIDSNVPKDYSVYTQTPAHGITVPFVYQSFWKFDVSISRSDLRVSNAVIDYYSNFIKFGDPNGPNDTTDDKAYAILTASNTTEDHVISEPSSRDQSDNKEGNDKNNNGLSLMGLDIVPNQSSTTALPHWPRSRPTSDLFSKLVFQQTDIQVYVTNNSADLGCEFLDEIGYSARKLNIPEKLDLL